MGKWLDKMWYTYKLECYVFYKKNDLELYWLKWKVFYKVLLRKEKYIKYLQYDHIFVNKQWQNLYVYEYDCLLKLGEKYGKIYTRVFILN